MPHALWESSFILTQFLVLNLAGWFWCLTNLLFFDITLLYYYILLKSSIIFCLFSGNICLSLRISLWSLLFSSSFLTVSELFCEVLEAFVIFYAILLPIKSPVASTVFIIALFEAVLSASMANCSAWSRSFWLYLLLKFY